MKNITSIKFKASLLLGLFLVIATGCERDLPENGVLAPFDQTATIFTDDFTGLGSNFYFPFVQDGAKPDVFSVDDTEGYNSQASIRIDVPNANDPGGSFAGASFVVDGGARDLTGYDALTFWAKASQDVIIGTVGFGQEYRAAATNLNFTTNWTQFIIPIPDPDKLTEVRQLLEFSAGSSANEGTGIVGKGYTFWLDEVKFEKLGTVAQPRPAIFNGTDETATGFIGSRITISGMTQTFNLASGLNQTVSATPAYFTFKSSDESIATVSAAGVIDVIGTGTTTITAILAGVKAAGSITVTSLGAFVPAPTPTRAAADVISVFSDQYTNIPVDFYNGFFAPFQTTLGGADINISGDNIIQYTNLNFVASEFKNPTIDISAMTHLHVDIQVQETIDTGDFIAVELGDFGADNVFGGNNDSAGRITFPDTRFTSNTWVSLDIPIADFTAAGLSNRQNLAQVFFISDGTISSILVDNIYFYK